MTLTEQEHLILLDWIKNNLIPIQSFNDVKTSYGLKHLFENSEKGFYIDNDCFKSAMLECGFRVKNERDLNWVFNISQKSHALKIK